jgi:MOSC domain-containing protein YiiM
MNQYSKITHMFCGQETQIDDGKRTPYKTAYKKMLMKEDQTLIVNELGFTNDTQSAKSHHGGVDKAVCVYSHKYYSFFKDTYDLNLPLCAFGENFMLNDFDDSQVCLGDIFQCGEALFEVSQPRQPCWKISSVLGIKNLTALVVKEHKTGFYFRVLQGGKIKTSDVLELVKREYPTLTIEHINQCAYNAKENQENIKHILQCDKLATAYRTSLSKRYKNKEYGIQEWQEDNYHQ